MTGTCLVLANKVAWDLIVGKSGRYKIPGHNYCCCLRLVPSHVYQQDMDFLNSLCKRLVSGTMSPPVNNPYLKCETVWR